MFSYSNWSVLTASFVVVTYLALSGVTLCSVLYLVGAKWRLQVRHLAVALFALFPLAFVLLLILLVGGRSLFPGSVTSRMVRISTCQAGIRGLCWRHVK